MEKLILLKKKLVEYSPLTAILVTVGGFFAAQTFGAIIVLIYGMVRGWSGDQLVTSLEESAWLTMLFGLVIYGFYLAVIRAYIKISKHSLSDIGLRWPDRKSEVISYTLVGYGVYFIAMIIATVIIKNAFPVIDLNQKQELGFDTYTTGIGLLPIFLSLVIIPPVVEEIATRGFLYTGLRSKWNIWVAGIITSIIFGAAHLQWESEAPLLWAAAIDTFILSAVLIYVREKTNSIMPAIGIHMIKNFLAFIALFILHVA